MEKTINSLTSMTREQWYQYQDFKKSTPEQQASRKRTQFGDLWAVRERSSDVFGELRQDEREYDRKKAQSNAFDHLF